jgi:hypothetical protein
MDGPKRIETVARALARFRLGKQTFVSSLNPDLVAKLRQSAEDKLWPSLVGEAAAVVEAIDAPAHDASGRAVDNRRHAATPLEGGSKVSEPGMVNKEGTIPVDQAPNASVTDRDFSEPLPGSTRPLPDPHPAAITPSPSPPPDAATEGLRSAIAALIASGRSGTKN